MAPPAPRIDEHADGLNRPRCHRRPRPAGRGPSGERDLATRLSEADAELERFRACAQLHQEVDAALELALRERLNLEQTLDRLFPLLGRHLGADAVWVRTFDEDLAESDFFWPDAERFPAAVDPLAASLSQGQPHRGDAAGRAVVAQVIDVAGEHFGSAGVAWPGAEAPAHAEALLDVWCENLDNYLAAIAVARRKHQLVSAFADALKNPVLNDGIDEAIAVLREHVGVDDLILVYRHFDDVDDATLAYKILKAGKTLYDSRAQKDAEVDSFVRGHGIDLLLRGDTRAVGERFGLRDFHEEVLISGLRPGQIVGRLLVARGANNDFSTFDRDLLHRFADFLRLRIVDFNREWQHLSLCFPRQTVRRLVGERDYVARYLRPRVRNVAVLFCDIVGFTQVSEQILRKPALIGKLIDTWSNRAVELIWGTGGVFDKMVGDCIIGLWGPPFFELSPREACASAVRSAMAIRDYTATLAETSGLSALKRADATMGVASGLNYCSLFVGRFGPNEGYTGFSSGMNNAARLQGVACRDEILCMESFVDAIGEGAAFGDEQQAQVKNVAEPLHYRQLLQLS